MPANRPDKATSKALRNGQEGCVQSEKIGRMQRCVRPQSSPSTRDGPAPRPHPRTQGCVRSQEPPRPHPARRMRAIPGTTYGLAGCYTLEGSPAIAAHYLYVHDGMNFPDGTSGLTHLIRMLRVQHQPSADSHLFTRVDKVFNRFNRPSGVAGSNPGADLDHHGTASILAW